MGVRKRGVVRRRCDVGVDDGLGEKESEGWNGRKRWEKGKWRHREEAIVRQEEEKRNEDAYIIQYI